MNHQVTDLRKRSLGQRCCAPDLKVGLGQVEAKSLGGWFQLLGHPVRLQILDILTRNEGQVCVCDLVAALPVKQPTVSHHLRILREHGLVGCTQRGLWAHYFLDRRRFEEIRAAIVRFADSLNIQRYEGEVADEPAGC